MSSVGETLRRERVSKNLSLEQISRDIKISTRFLEAIENEQFDRLPGGVFARSFVRQYARLLGLDEEELAGEVQRTQDIETEVPVFQPSSPQPSFKVPKLKDWEGGSASRTSSPWASLAMVVAVMLVCAGIYAWWQNSRRAAASQPSAPARVAAAPLPKTAEPASVVPAAVKTVEAAAPPVESPKPAPEQSAGGAGALHVSLSADSPTWVRAWADGKEVMTATLQPNETKTVNAVDGIRLRTGNAGDLHVTFNGKPVGSLGPKGQIRTVQLTTQGVQIDLPPKPDPPGSPRPEPL